MDSLKNSAGNQSESPFFKSRDIKNKKSGKSTLSQVVAMLVLVWLLFDFGLEATVPTIVIGALHNNPAEDLNMTDEQVSWLGSIMFFTHPLGALISGFLQEHLGRKRSLLLVNIPMFVAWNTLYMASSVNQLIFASGTLGICIGFCEAPLHSYIGEISEPRLRGTLSAIGTAAALLGCLIMCIIGYLLPWRKAAFLSSLVPIITFISITQIPESPTWLIMNDRLKDAQKSLSWLRGWLKPEEVQEEFQRLLENTENKARLNRSRVFQKELYEMVPNPKNGALKSLKDDNNRSYFKTVFQELTDKRLYLPLRMVSIVFFFGTGTQLTAMRPFMVGVLKEFGLPLDNYMVLVLISVFCLGGAMMNVFFVRQLGKRQIMLFCQAVISLSILLLGVYCSYITGLNTVHGITWIPISLFASVFFFSGFSIMLVPWQLCAEVFPVEGRGTAQGLIAAWAYSVSFVMSKTYLYLERLIQLKGVFFFYGAFSLIGLFYYWRYLPETEGKSLEEIEVYFTGNCDKAEKHSKEKHNNQRNSVPSG